MPSLLSLLQQLLQRLYHLDVEERIDDFVITDRRLAHILRGRDREVPEELLVMATGDTLELSLYLDAGLLAQQQAGEPLRRLRQTQLNGFCALLEGVSHFLYLVTRARESRAVTRLEMELQAEVDKYAVLGYLLKAQRQGTLPGWLPRRLFEAVSYHADLDAEERTRYTTANAYARRYCRRLQRRFQWAWNGTELLRELRAFHRLDQPRKLRHINRLA